MHSRTPRRAGIMAYDVIPTNAMFTTLVDISSWYMYSLNNLEIHANIMIIGIYISFCIMN